MKTSKNFRVNDIVLVVLEECANSAGSTETRAMEAAVVAYGAKILGHDHPDVAEARGVLLADVNKNRN